MEKLEKKQKKVKVRGTGCYDPETQKFGFEPFNKAPSTQVNVVNCKGGGKAWDTTGANPSKMLSLKTKLSSPDPYSDLLTQFNALTRDMKPKKPVEQSTELRVVAENGLQCWLDETKNEVTYMGTLDLTKHPRDWPAEVLRQVQLVVRRLPASERFTRIINQIKNGGNK